MNSKLAGRLEGKVVVITGASTGIGRSAMEMFAQAGARVVGVARTKATLDEGRERLADWVTIHRSFSCIISGNDLNCIVSSIK